MNPTTALVIIATVVAIRPFFELTDSKAKARALKAGGYVTNAKHGCLYMLLLPVLVGLWWWYALTTDQILLGIIPTIGSAMTVLAITVERVATSEQGGAGEGAK